MTAMTADVAPHRSTADQFLARDFPTGSELVEGVVHVMDPVLDHQEVCGRPYAAILLRTRESELGRSGFGVRSPTTWALGIGPKPRRDESAGARELRLVDHPVSTVLVLRRDETSRGFDDGHVVGPGDVLTSPLLPGFALPIDELFADL